MQMENEFEVNQCVLVGALRPHSPNFPLISSGEAVGLRWATSVPKRILTSGDPVPEPELDEGRFARRPHTRLHLLVDDVLCALRLYKPARIVSTGYAGWARTPTKLQGGARSQLLSHGPYFGNKYELLVHEVPPFLELWRLMYDNAERFSFALHRFNLSFDRGLLADRLVDLIIAAEVLFLGDQSDKSELSFRCSMRAAKFIESSTYDEHGVFKVLRRAYNLRSSVVHGGSLSVKAPLPDNPSADIPTFTNVVEELIRQGLKKALSMKEDGARLRDSAYWDSLLFAKGSSS